MKFLCDACERLVEPSGFRMEGEALVLMCPRCQSESKHDAKPPPPLSARPQVVPFAPRPAPVEMPAAETPAPMAVVIPAAERCPKCASPKEGRSACAKCGLIFDLYIPEEDAISNSARKSFEALLSAGEKPFELSTEQLSQVARLCRHHLADFPGDARATALLQRLTAHSLALAQSATAGLKDDPPQAKNLQKLLLWAVFALALALAFGVWEAWTTGI